MSKHTPGPWEIYNSKFVPVELAAGSKMYVIQTADDHNDNVGFACSWLDDPETLKEAEANARLIAAAPDLLDALEKACKRLEANLSDDRDMGRGSMTYLLELFESTIARARGEA